MKRMSLGSSCTIDKIYPEDSGEYWCETERGERSNNVNIMITAGSVILESPALPVTEGDDVTLRCRNKTNSTQFKAYFYKDGQLIHNGTAKEMKINNVSKSDEGLYKCSIQGVGPSPESWLTVRAHTVPITSPPSHKEPVSHDSDSPEVFILLWIVVTVLVVALVLLVGVGFLHVRKHRAWTMSLVVQKCRKHRML
ncbi:low affinity immunoglobulin gamma Fc region receptor III-A-like [Trachinotus anak]|uniref:low affinity immunoglobulin gamma Fc region receptor III-A-like n=1 Tax=Trachinotus anak TaxID=443729 RepID=UPI0039F192D1